MNDSVVAIKIGDRWFNSISRSGRVITGWSFASAKLYNPSCTNDLEHDLKIITERGKEYRLCPVIIP